MAPFCSCPASLVSRFFFPVPAPNGASPCPAFPQGRSKKKKHLGGVFFALAPCRRPTGLLLLLPFAGAAAKKKKNTLGGVLFFALAPCRHGASPSPAFPRGRSKKKKTPLGGVLFFAAAPPGRSLTHCGPGWRCLPLAGVVFFFLLRPRPDRGGVFFFLLWPRPDAHSLTVGWGDFGKVLDNNKKCLGYYILKRPGGATAKKKNTTSNPEP